MACLFQGTMFESHQDLDQYVKILSEPNKKKRRAGMAAFRQQAKKTPLTDRVFICLGTLNAANDNRKHAWVMTINREFDTITFWEPLKSINYKLEGRIKSSETEWLKNYLSPQLTVKEKKQFRLKTKKAMKKKEEAEKKELELKMLAELAKKKVGVWILNILFRRTKARKKAKVI